MAENIRVSIITADETIFSGKAKYVNIPTDFGSLGILSGHAPMLCSVGEGNIKCSFEEGGILVRTGKGIANVADNEVTIMVSHAEILD